MYIYKYIKNNSKYACTDTLLSHKTVLHCLSTFFLRIYTSNRVRNDIKSTPILLNFDVHVEILPPDLSYPTKVHSMSVHSHVIVVIVVKYVYINSNKLGADLGSIDILNC